jgi:Protein of unknown function (DUF4232)
MPALTRAHRRAGWGARSPRACPHRAIARLAAVGLAAALLATAMAGCGVALASRTDGENGKNRLDGGLKPGPAECKAAQLQVLFFGQNGAAGTGNTSIGIANITKTPCWLQGSPTVRVTVEAVSATRPGPPMAITHSGPAFLFPVKVARVVLHHDQPTPPGVAGSRYPSISAGFVILNDDSGAPGPCPQVTFVSVRLPGLAAEFAKVHTQIFACGNFISVSPVLARVPVIGAVYEGTGTI